MGTGAVMALNRRGPEIALRNRLADVTSDDELEFFVQTAQAVFRWPAVTGLPRRARFSKSPVTYAHPMKRWFRLEHQCGGRLLTG
jgi:hypothetical protein